MSTLDLHIGLHKTGTSSLQAFFVKNEAVLQKSSVLYPQAGRIGRAHYQLSRAADSGADLCAILAQMHEEGTEFEHVLVSSEDLSHSFLDPHKLRRFCKAARKHFSLRVILYIRRQDDLKESIYAQVAKDWYRGAILDEKHYEYDHLKRINILRSEIEPNELVVRLYQRTGRETIEDDFLSLYGFTAAQGFAPVDRENVSFSRQITAILSKVDKRELENRYEFPRYLAKSGLWSENGPRHFMSLAQRTAFLKQYEDSNRTVAEQFFPELGGALFEAPTEEEGWFAPAPPHEDEYLRLIATLWNEYVQLRRAINAMKRNQD